MSADSYVRIFRTSPVWQKWKSPDFLDKSCLAKTQKSGFFGVRILSEPLYIQFYQVRDDESQKLTFLSHSARASGNPSL